MRGMRTSSTAHPGQARSTSARNASGDVYARAVQPADCARNTTERPEAVRAGAVRVVGTNSASVLNAISRLYDRPEVYARMSVPVFPYGDGQAAKRIVDAMHARFAMHARLERDVATLSAA